MKRQWVWSKKVYINGVGHMTKLTAMPIMFNHLESSSLEPLPMILSIELHEASAIMSIHV